MPHDYLGTNYIGQQQVRSKINFYIESQRNTGFLPPLFLHARRGDGKSLLAREIAKNLIDRTGKPKIFIEVNGSQLQGSRALSSFIYSVISPFISEQEATLFIDEIDSAERSILDWMLSVVQPNRENKSEVCYFEDTFYFDFAKFSFLSASTNIERLRESLRNRLTRIELGEYTNEELIKILQINSSNLEYQESVENEIIKVCRNSPRTVVKMATENILRYCEQKACQSFNLAKWNDLCSILHIRPLGLEPYEVKYLQLLNQRNQMSLTGIAACLCMDTGAVRKGLELFLLQQGLIFIDGKRHLTHKGREILKKIV